MYDSAHVPFDPKYIEISMNLPCYDAVRDALSLSEVDRSVAETHGLLSAFLALGVNIEKSAWLNSLQSHAEPVSDDDSVSESDREKAHAALISVFETTHHMFLEDTYSFQLLLPEDDALFEARVNAFAEWCQGFVSGLNLMSVNFKKKYTPDLDEALQDLIKFSCLAINPQDNTGSQEDESAYMELVEYARIAVMLIHAHQEIVLPTPVKKH